MAFKSSSRRLLDEVMSGNSSVGREQWTITIVTPGKNKIVISDDAKSILLQDQNDNKVELKPAGIALDSPKDITINAKALQRARTINASLLTPQFAKVA